MTDLAKLRELLEKATKGDWTAVLNNAGYFDISPNMPEEDQWRGGVATCHEAEHIDGITLGEATANAHLICALRNEAPALLDEVEKLRAALREVVAAAQTQLESHGKGIEPSQRLADAFNAARQALGDGG